MRNLATGAMPGPGATPDRRYSFGPEWAAYRLPFAGLRSTFSRDAGVAFEGEPAPTGGATPPAGGDPPKSADPPRQPATGQPPEPDADGMTTDAGREALRREREARKAAERERDEARAATATDAEKHDHEVRAAAGKDRDEFWSARIRQTEVRSALRAEGLTDEKALALAANAPAFSELKVNAEDGTVADLSRTVASFKTDYPQLFAAPAKPAPSGQPTRGPQNGAPGDRPKTLGEAIAAGMGARA